MDASPYRRLIPREKRAQLSFSHNDYLGLATDPRMIQVIQDHLPHLGWGSTGSRLLSGDRQITHDLEDRLATFKHKPAALVVSSGYAMNVSVLDALVGPGDLIIADKYSHASLMDGARLSGAKLIRFAHNNYDHLDTLLTRYRSLFNKAVIVTESVFSMDGDCADIDRLITLKTAHRAELYIDEAHAIGVMGANSEGLISRDQADQVDYIAGTLGKAFGSVGGFIATSTKTKSFLINHTRALIYSTALPAIHAVATLCAMDIIYAENPGPALLTKAQGLRLELSKYSCRVLGSTHIIPIQIGEEERTLQLAAQLHTAGIDIPAIRYPTVPKGQSRLRISLSATHSQNDVAKLLNAIAYLTSSLITRYA